MSSKAARTTSPVVGVLDKEGIRVVAGVEAEAGKEGESGQGQLAEDGGGEGYGFAAEAEAGFGYLLEGIDVVLVLAGEELAHFEVDTVDVGGEGEDSEEKNEGDGVDVGGGHLPPRLLPRGATDKMRGSLHYAPLRSR